MTEVLYQSLKIMRDRPLSMSLLSLVISSGKYSSSLSTISNVPTEMHRQTTFLVHLLLNYKQTALIILLVVLLNSLTILAGIKAGERRSEHLDKVAHAPQVLVHVPEVRVDVVSIPEKSKVTLQVSVKIVELKSNKQKRENECQNRLQTTSWIDIHTSLVGRSSCAGCHGESILEGNVGYGTGPIAPSCCGVELVRFSP